MLDCVDLPLYDQDRLAETWDNIIKEYDEKSGEYIFHTYTDDAVYNLEKWAQMQILRACYGLLRLNTPTAVKEALTVLRTDFGIKADKSTLDLIASIRSMILKRETAIRIDSVKDEKPAKGNQYIRTVVQLTNIIGTHIDPRKISTTEYIELNKIAKEIIAAKQPKQQEWDKL